MAIRTGNFSESGETLFPLIAFNYFFYSLVALFISYLPVYFSSEGISPAQLGILLGIGPLISIIAPPFWGFLSDKWKTVKKVILIILSASVVLGTVLFHSTSFGWMLLLSIIYNFFMSPIGPLTDGLTYRISTHHEKSFGSIRLWGSIGFATTALIMGYLFDRFGLDYLFAVYLGYGMVALFACLRLKDAPAVTKPVSMRSVGILFRNRRILHFLSIILILSIPHRINDGFLGVYIESIGGTTGEVGQAWFLATGSEALALGLSVRWLRNGKELQLMAAASVFYCIRWILCTVMAEPIWISYFQLFHGLTFAVYYLAALQYFYKLIPNELQATGQTVFAAVFFGVAGILGSLFAGWIFGLYGGRTLYVLMTGFSLTGLFLVIHAIFQRTDIELES